VVSLPLRASAPLALLAAITLSALLLGLYARGSVAWVLGFVLLVPWLWALQRASNVGHALLLGAAMSVGYVLAALHWFAPAVASYTGWPLPVALVVLALCAPLLQPQCVAYALTAHLVVRRYGPMVAALAAASAWVACEALLPKLLGDTLGHGLQPASLLRQSADLWGAAGLSFVLLLVNAAVIEALRRARESQPAKQWLKPLCLALALPLSLALYGLWRTSDAGFDPPADAARLRVAMVQSNITHYEALRREIGAYAVVRKVLDTHYALSDQAIAEQRADALLWSETVYPTPFGHPRSADGAELDREIEAYARSRRVPLVFGTYDVDGAGEYNAAAFLDPERGLLGYYRKTHPFPLTEYVPSWLDSAALRRALPWAGTWQPGHGPRVMPVRAADGREVDVLPLICLDAVHPQLAIEGARLGAQAILGLSNDAWFTQWPQGAELHLAVASFRSIETRLPQLRVTTNGISAVIDARGEIVARSAMGEAAVLVGELAAHDPPPTLMLRLGDWIGRAGLLFLALLSVHALWRTLATRWPRARRAPIADLLAGDGLPVLVLSRMARASIGWAQGLLALGLVWMGVRMLVIDGLQVTSLRPLQHFAFFVLAPAFALWALQRAFAARAFLREGLLCIESGSRRIELPLSALAAAQAWRLPVPSPGLQLRTQAGERLDLALPSSHGVIAALHRAGAPPAAVDHSTPNLLQHWAEQRLRGRHRWLDAPWLKLGLFPLLPALVAFHLHQVIAFGGPFGEWLTFGFSAWFKALLLWWASWVLGLCLLAAALRALVEAAALAVLALQGFAAGRAVAAGQAAAGLPSAHSASPLRDVMEWGLRALHYLGVPVWLLLRVL
jgi:apolipoprotein N-acyltransferase